MKKEKIPTIIGLLLLVVGIVAGVFLVKSQQLFRLGATSQATPKDVRISNITDTSFTVSWITDEGTTSFVKWGKNQNTLDKVEYDSVSEKGYIHAITVRGLTAQTQYFFKINSNGKDFDNQGNVWQVKTGNSLKETREAVHISGKVVNKNGAAVKNSLIYFSVGGGSLLSTVTSQNGSWLIPISSARNKTLDSFLTIDQKNTLVEISVNAGPLGVASAQIYPQSAKPAPEIVLGQVNDFKNAPVSKSGDLPYATIEVPEGQKETESGFEVGDQTGKTSQTIVTLDSLDEGEVISATNPEFFGKGPSGTKIEITVESEMQTDSVSVSSSGNWNWSPPSDLKEGSHKVTIKWRDAEGILRTITRNFIVQAAESPAFVSTPSATPKQTQSPSPTPVSTKSATPTSVSTSSAAKTPDSGFLTPTLLLSIMGVGTIIFALFLWKKAEEN